MSEFRVIVVGAGIGGLTASHCLQKAAIDHVVLERRPEIDPPEGASIAIYPHLAGILEQIGCLNEMIRTCKPVQRFRTRWPDGKLLFDNPYFHHIKASHGQDVLLLERRRYLRLLYDNLPDKRPIRTGVAVKDVIQTASGVEVFLSDGSCEKGDLVLGCDGAYSLTRGKMWDHADAVSPGLITPRERGTLETRWKCLVGMGPPEPSLGESDMTAVHDHRFSFLTLTQPDHTFWFVFFRLDKPFKWPQRAYYTSEDAEALAASVADHAVSETLRFGQLWDRRNRGELISIEEGVLEHWFSGRVVLAGDAVQKATPNIGLGGNSAIEMVVVLCNHISRMMIEQQGARPSRATLERQLKAYQEECRDHVSNIVWLSGLITCIQAWEYPWARFLAVWVLPWLPRRSIATAVGLVIRTAPRLEVLGGGHGKHMMRKGTTSLIYGRFDLQNSLKILGALGILAWLGLQTFNL